MVILQFLRTCSSSLMLAQHCLATQEGRGTQDSRPIYNCRELHVLAATHMHKTLGAVQTFLDDMEHQLRTDPNFKGQLGNSQTSSECLL